MSICGGVIFLFMLWAAYEWGYTAGINDALDELDDLGLGKEEP